MRAVQAARIEAIHALPVHRVDVGNLLLEGRHVHERNENHRARDRGRVDLLNQPLDRDDRGVFGPVRARHDGEHRTRLRAMHDGHGNRQRRVDAGGYLNGPEGLLAARGGRGADGERRAVLGGSDTTGQQQEDQPEP